MAAVARVEWRRFEALTVGELYAVLALRNAVFVVEQGCAFMDIDGRDETAVHLLAWLEGCTGLAATLRVIAPDIDGRCAHIGRVATAAWARRIGLGGRIMREAVEEVGRRYGPIGIEVAAQTSVEGFYAGLGFRRISEDFDEDGVVHCRMRR